MKYTHIWLYFYSFIPFCCFCIGYIGSSIWLRAPSIKTPSLIGMSVHDAIVTLSSMQLNTHIIAEIEDPHLPTGTILNQSPSATCAIKQHQLVYLAISKQPNLIITPSYQGLSLDQVTQTLQCSHIRYKIYFQKHPHADHTCIAQSPAPGSPLTDTLIIYISQREDSLIICPSFIGKSVMQVQEFLSEYGIVPSMVSDNSAPISDTKNSYVQDQRPLPGTILNLHELRTVQIQV